MNSHITSLLMLNNFTSIFVVLLRQKVCELAVNKISQKPLNITLHYNFENIIYQSLQLHPHIKLNPLLLHSYCVPKIMYGWTHWNQHSTRTDKYWNKKCFSHINKVFLVVYYISLWLFSLHFYSMLHWLGRSFISTMYCWNR